jgi:hypothetical protein
MKKKPIYAVNNFMKKNPLLLKAALLCHGLKNNKDSLDLYSFFNPHNTKRTGNVGIHFKINGYVVNAILYDIKSKSSIDSPYQLKKLSYKGSTGWFLFENERSVSLVELINPPSWYNKKTSNNKFMGQVFLSEGDNNLMGSLGISCCYFKTSKQCQFCAYQGGKNKYSPSDFSEAVKEAYKFNNDITITITSGNTFDEDRGIKNYYPYIEAIRDISSSIPIQLECSPPKKMLYLDQAIDRGVDSFSINYELWDDQIRKKVLPAKSEIPKETYVQAWKHIQSRLGDGRISSAIIFGIESPQSSLIGAKWLISNRVRPNVIPFKPMLGAKLQDRNPPDYQSYYKFCDEVAREIKKNSLDISQRLGCSSCGGCNLEGDFKENL